MPDYPLRNSATTDIWLEHAISEIESVYGVSVTLKNKSLLKFGRNDSVGTQRVTVHALNSQESYVTSNVIDSISSTDAGDVGAFYLEGHTIDGSGNLTFVVQTGTLNGRNRVALTTPLARVTRCYNASSVDLLGNLYVYQNTAITNGVPDDLTKAHLFVSAERNQSEKAATSFSQYDYGILTNVYGSINQKTTAVCDISLWIRNKGGVFRKIFNQTVASGGNNTFTYDFKPYMIIPANADVEIRALASTTNVSISAGFNCLLGYTGG